MLEDIGNLLPEGIVPEGIIPEGIIPEGIIPEGLIPAGIIPEIAVPEGLIPMVPALEIAAVPTLGLALGGVVLGAGLVLGAGGIRNLLKGAVSGVVGVSESLQDIYAEAKAEHDAGASTNRPSEIEVARA